MLKLSSAYAATWRAAFGDRDLRYNEKVWSLVQEHHAPDDSFVGLMDRSDGSTFILRVEQVDALGDVGDEDLWLFLEKDLRDERFGIEWIRNWDRSVDGLPFAFTSYGFINPKFGEQTLVNAFARIGGEVVILRITWPKGLPSGAGGFPTKLEVLLEGLTLQAPG